jgi:hypothetical protein
MGCPNPSQYLNDVVHTNGTLPSAPGNENPLVIDQRVLYMENLDILAKQSEKLISLSVLKNTRAI